MSEYINHEKAYSYVSAHYHTSNIARCYLDLRERRNELLEALEEALPMLHTGDELPMSYYKDKPGALGKALRAIAKAKGEV